ncbi:MAG: hypothetical protein KTR25_15590 [Myxococcales bacterium]|nr:hypothetical protein [Myxococcales bacterium]
MLNEIPIRDIKLDGLGKNSPNGSYVVAMPDPLSERGTLFIFRSYAEYQAAIEASASDKRVGIDRQFTHYYHRLISFERYDDAVRALIENSCTLNQS